MSLDRLDRGKAGREEAFREALTKVQAGNDVYQSRDSEMQGKGQS